MYTLFRIPVFSLVEKIQQLNFYNTIEYNDYQWCLDYFWACTSRIAMKSCMVAHEAENKKNRFKYGFHQRYQIEEKIKFTQKSPKVFKRLAIVIS